jgi:hypothetical protein
VWLAVGGGRKGPTPTPTSAAASTSLPSLVLCSAGSMPVLHALHTATSSFQGVEAAPPAGTEHGAAAEVVHAEEAAAEAPSVHAQRQQSLREQLAEVRAQLEVRDDAPYGCVESAAHEAVADLACTAQSGWTMAANGVHISCLPSCPLESIDAFGSCP